MRRVDEHKLQMYGVQPTWNIFKFYTVLELFESIVGYFVKNTAKYNFSFELIKLAALQNVYFIPAMNIFYQIEGPRTK